MKLSKAQKIVISVVVVGLIVVGAWAIYALKKEVKEIIKKFKREREKKNEK